MAASSETSSQPQAQILSLGSEVDEVMRRVNDHWLATHPDPGDNKWARSVYFTGNMAHFNMTNDAKYLDYSWAWAENHNWQLNGGCDTEHADNQVAGQTYIALNEIDTNRVNLSCIITSMNNAMTWGWLEVDLGAIYSINRVRLHPYQERAYRYSIEVKTTMNGTYQPVIDRWENTQGGSVITDTIATAVDAQFVRLRVVGAHGYTGAWVSIEEFEIFGASEPANNLALGQPVICSSEPEPQNPCSNIVDGDLNSRWSAWFSASFSEQSPNWWWIDALYMAMPVYAKLCHLLNDQTYCKAIHVRYNDTKEQRGLFDDTEGLWYRDERFIYDPNDPSTQTPNGEKIFWSRGNGWVFAAHARALEILSPEAPHRAEYVAIFQEMAAALKAVQRPDGFWNVSLFDPNHYSGPETSGTAFFTFGMAWGINNGYLEPSEYGATVAKAWNAMIDVAIDHDGRVGYCQPVGSEPVMVPPENTEDFCVGAFLLAGSEVYKLTADEQIDITKSGPAIVAVKSPITYTLSISNSTSLTLTDVLISDTLPVGASYLSGGTLVGDVVSWKIPKVRSNETVTRQFSVTATRTITNSSYSVSTKEGYGAVGNQAVLTIVEEPVAGLSANNSSPTLFGQTTTLTATIIKGENVIYTWEFGDGQNSFGPVVTHIYPDVGLYTAVVTANNSVSVETTETIVTIEKKWAIHLPVLFNSFSFP